MAAEETRSLLQTTVRIERIEISMDNKTTMLWCISGMISSLLAIFAIIFEDTMHSFPIGYRWAIAVVIIVGQLIYLFTSIKRIKDIKAERKRNS